MPAPRSARPRRRRQALRAARPGSCGAQFVRVQFCPLHTKPPRAQPSRRTESGLCWVRLPLNTLPSSGLYTCPDHLLEPLGFMLSTMGTPMIGRVRLAASTLFLSVFGLPVSGSFGSLSQMMLPHRAPPQSLTLTRDLPPSVSQVPIGSADAASLKLNTASAMAAARRMVMTGLPIWPGYGRSRFCRLCGGQTTDDGQRRIAASVVRYRIYTATAARADTCSRTRLATPT